MPETDYYEVLQVHPRAERIVIEAAFRRLAREYHPDVYKGSDAHTRMVGLNEAWDVLGDPERRAEYDSSRKAPPSGSSRKRDPQPSDAKYSASAPVAPEPSRFGIGADYWDKAVEGARAWKKRRKVLPDIAQTIIFILFAGGGIAITAMASAPELASISSVSGYGWIAGIALGYGLSVGVQQLHDMHLLKSEFNPRYNPDPAAYAKYAEEYSKYETEICDVHVTRTGSCYHSRNYCGGTMGTLDLPMFEAKSRGYRPCSHCGYFTIRPRLLPPPFGVGRIPEEDKPP